MRNADWGLRSVAAGELSGIHAVWLREFLVFKREKSRVVSSLVTPLMWTFLFGSGIGSSYTPVTGIGYQAFIFPGIIIMGMSFSAVFFGLYIIWDKKIDVLKAVLVAPVSRTAIFLGKVLGGCTDVMIQATLLLFIGVALFRFDPLGLAAAFLVLLLTAMGLVAVGLALGSFFESAEGFQMLISFLIFPLFFTSGALYPVDDKLPGWLMVLTRLNPLSYSVDGVRGSLLGYSALSYGAVPALLVDGAVVAGFAAGMILFGAWAFSRMK